MRKDAYGALRPARDILVGPQPSRDEARVLADDAAYGLARTMPELSAHIVAVPWQKLALAVLAISGVAVAIGFPNDAWPLLTAATSLAFVTGTAFRAGLALVAARKRPYEASPPDDDLPAYTIVVPLYREANVLPRLVQSLLQLDYPDTLAQAPQAI